MDTKDTNIQKFPPVVAVLGHVDHGKTTLLDVIRKTSISERESGGITQRIGASSVEIDHEGKKRWITFIDTPGHQAFVKMRSRGALASDVGLLIVSADDAVMPQTKESIALLKASKIPYIVVITKIDSPGKNPEKVKKDLAKEKDMVEGYGGNVPGIEVWANDITCKVRNLLSDIGKPVTQATVGDAVEILGFEKTPDVGSVITKEKLGSKSEIKKEESQNAKNKDSFISLNLVAD